MLEIKSINHTKEIKLFIDFPYDLYSNSIYWVPPLRLAQKDLFDFHENPFWKYCKTAFYLAFKNDKIVGRVAAIINHDYNTHHNSNTGFFGFIDAIDDEQVFRALLEAVENYLKTNGCTEVIGPVNPSINYELGTLCEGFDSRPKFMMVYNPPYYKNQIEHAGYKKEHDFFAYSVHPNNVKALVKPERIINLIGKRYDVKVRKIRKKNFSSELVILHDIYNDAFNQHYGFSPMSLEEFEHMAKDMSKIVVEDYLLIAEINDEPVGFILCLPDYNEIFSKLKHGKLLPFGWLKLINAKSRINSVRVLTAAVKTKYQHCGVGAFLYANLINAARDKKVQQAELSWIAEDNVRMNKVAIGIGGTVSKKYRLFRKNL